MYMLRAYQSPASAADCGPQWAQMPNLASRNQSGARYASSDCRVPLNGPSAIGGISGASAPKAAGASCIAGKVAAIALRALRRLIPEFEAIGGSFLCRVIY